MKNTFLVFLFIQYAIDAVAQNLITNPGFGGIAGVTVNTVFGWNNTCAYDVSLLPYGNAGDCRNVAPVEGDTYLGFLFQYAGIYLSEKSGSKLIQSLLPQRAYMLSVWLQEYQNSCLTGAVYSGGAAFKVAFGNQLCENIHSLYVSDSVSVNSWSHYQIAFRPSSEYSHILMYPEGLGFNRYLFVDYLVLEQMPDLQIITDSLAQLTIPYHMKALSLPDVRYEWQFEPEVRATVSGTSSSVLWNSLGLNTYTVTAISISQGHLLQRTIRNLTVTGAPSSKIRFSGATRVCSGKQTQIDLDWNPSDSLYVYELNTENYTLSGRTLQVLWSQTGTGMVRLATTNRTTTGISNYYVIVTECTDVNTCKGVNCLQARTCSGVDCVSCFNDTCITYIPTCTGNHCNTPEPPPDVNSCDAVEIKPCTCPGMSCSDAYEKVLFKKYFSAFSPNGDGKNDVWQIESKEPYTFFTVFDTWGNVVFESETFENSWNGTDKHGRVLPGGLYYFLLQGAASLAPASGYLLLIR